ncbi:MAG: flagellar biosynthesis repressor FlbT [Rhodomicrobium sp.]|nr:flagellar biosynthesis repressor FlbT [Rhodomicrobium sp.]
MRRGMQVSLKAGERIFINGAVLRVDRKVSIELLNDVTFLLESHVLQADQATTPLRQLYFVVQTMLMDPASAETVSEVFAKTSRLLMTAFTNQQVLDGIRSVNELIAAGKIFEALKTIRSLYPIEESILTGVDETGQNISEKREVA